MISDDFPTERQALAGAVFNTIAQLGSSIGVTTASVVSTSVTSDSSYRDRRSQLALLEGYRAAFWLLFSFMGLGTLIGGIGLRKIGRIGKKRE